MCLWHLDNSLNWNQVFDIFIVFLGRISILEKGFSKVENKYTLRIKSCGGGLADDGYKWRKYGQKSIKNSPNPR